MTRLQYLLTLLSEECGETAQRASKAIRFGLKEIRPEQSLTNAEMIVHEFNDTVAIMEILQQEGFIGTVIDRKLIEEKKIKVAKWTEYSLKCGTITLPTPIPLHPVEICEPNPDMICKCGHKELPKKVFKFHTREDGKREIRQTDHCKKCNAEGQYCAMTFFDKKAEIEYKEKLDKSGVKWIE